MLCCDEQSDEIQLQQRKKRLLILEFKSFNGQAEGVFPFQVNIFEHLAVLSSDVRLLLLQPDFNAFHRAIMHPLAASGTPS